MTMPIYVVGDSRINIAGLCGGKHEPFAAAVAKVRPHPENSLRRGRLSRFIIRCRKT